MSYSLREFQINALGETYGSMQKHQRTLLVSPTGSGKTVMAAALCDRLIEEGQRVLFLASRRELIHQTCDKFEEAMGWLHGRDLGVIMAGVDGAADLLHLPMQIASKDTLASRTARGRLVYPRADTVLVDEAHLSLSTTWQRMLQHYVEQGSKIVGLTATPVRQGGAGLGAFYENMVQAPTTRELIDLGFLVPGTYYAPSTPNMQNVRTDYRRGDFNEADLDAVMSDNVIMGDVIQHWLKHAGSRRTVVFACSIKHSIALAEKFVRAGVAAEHIDGSADTEKRDGTFSRFRSGETQVLVNCAIATYGFDLPALDCVVLARPTKSLALHLQMMGRGLRTYPGKDDCLFLDHAGNVNRLGFAEDLQPWNLDPNSTIFERKEKQEKEKPEKTEPKKITCGQCSHIFTGQHKCPKCGWEVPRRGEDVEHAEGELVKVSSSIALPDLQKWYRMFLWYAKSKGYAPGWAYHKLREKHGFSAPKAWMNVQPLEPNEEVKRYIKYLNIRSAKSGYRRAS